MTATAQASLYMLLNPLWSINIGECQKVIWRDGLHVISCFGLRYLVSISYCGRGRTFTDLVRRRCFLGERWRRQMTIRAKKGLKRGLQFVAVVSGAEMWLKFGAERPKRSRNATSMLHNPLILDVLGYSRQFQPAFDLLSWKRRQLMWFFPLDYDVNHGYLPILPAVDGYFADNTLL